MTTFKRNALGVRDMLNRKYDTFKFEGAWHDAFGNPEKRGVWFIWGGTGSGKTTFVMQLCKYLCQFGKVAYNSMEEGDCQTMQNTLKKCGMNDVAGRFLVIDNESIEQLDLRLSQRKAPQIIVIDSFQYTQLSYKSYIQFKEKHRNKLIIFISHADGKKPAGRAAVSVCYDASLKIYVEGYRAFSKGRYYGATMQYDIWPKAANQYWGNRNEDNKEQTGDTAAD